MSRMKPPQTLVSITPVAGQRLVIRTDDLKYSIDRTWHNLIIIDFSEKKVRKVKKEGK